MPKTTGANFAASYLRYADAPHSHFDEFLPLLAGRQHDAVDDAALRVAQRQAGVSLGEALDRACRTCEKQVEDGY